MLKNQTINLKVVVRRKSEKNILLKTKHLAKIRKLVI